MAGDPNAIGYISLGSLDDTVKAVSIDGVAPSAAAVKDGSYAIARPFNVVTKGDLSAPAADFFAFIMSADGQAVVSDNNYIAIDDAAAQRRQWESGRGWIFVGHAGHGEAGRGLPGG